jgi:chromatin segregation and condensation protein Rec8/ScpA/Scc1 (kleisin family)
MKISEKYLAMLAQLPESFLAERGKALVQAICTETQVETTFDLTDARKVHLSEEGREAKKVLIAVREEKNERKRVEAYRERNKYYAFPG